jgi:hypothetical protein
MVDGHSNSRGGRAASEFKIQNSPFKIGRDYVTATLFVGLGGASPPSL